MFRLFDCVGARGDELVRSVVLVRGDEECAAETRAGLADGATEGVFIRTTPARRGESRGAFVGLGPVRTVFVGGLHDTVEQGFLGATVGIGDGRVGHGAVCAERADRRAHKPGMHYYISGTLSLVPGTLYLRQMPFGCLDVRRNELAVCIVVNFNIRQRIALIIGNRKVNAHDFSPKGTW